MATHTTTTTHQKSNGKRPTRPQARKKPNGKNGNGHVGTNGNGNGQMLKAELEVMCAELTAQNQKLTLALAEYREQIVRCHRYLDALRVPSATEDAPGMLLHDRVVAGVKLWFAKHGGMESSDHVSTTLRAMLQAAGEWRCLYPGAYPDDVPTL